MDKRFLRLQSNPGDLVTPQECVTPFDHSTSTKSGSSSGTRKFFPSLSEDSPPISNVFGKTQNVVDLSSRSSLGILHPEEMEASQFSHDNSNFVWQQPKKSDVFKKPLPKSLSAQKPDCGLDSRYFKETEMSIDDSQLPLDVLLGTTMENISQGAVDNFDWSRVFKSDEPPKISIIPPSNETSIDASFFKGALSGRSTSIGGASNNQRTLDENFEDYSGCQVNADIDFTPIATDNAALMDAEEAEFKEEHKFCPYEVITNDATMSKFENEGFNVTSQSQYFSQNTSRLGSLETSQWPPPEEVRPHLGMGKITSPEKEPIRMVQESIDKTFTKEEQKDLDLKKLFRMIPSGKGMDAMKAIIKNIIDDKASHNVNETMSANALTSFLEASLLIDQTVDDTNAHILKKSPGPEKKSCIPVLSPKQESKSCKQEVETLKRPAFSRTTKQKESTKLQSRLPSQEKENFAHPNKFPSMGMKSRLPVSNEKLLKKPLTETNRLHRHSSPIKLPEKLPERPPSQDTFVKEKGKREGAVAAAVDFPLVSNRMMINWIDMDVGERREDTLILKNITETKATVALAIKNCADFRLAKSDVMIGPGEFMPVCIEFNAASPGMKNGILTIRVHGFRNPRGKSVKSSIQLRGFVGKPALEMTSPDLKISGDGYKLTLFNMANDVATVKEINVNNVGNADGIIALQMFTDGDMKKASNFETGAIRSNFSKAVIPAGESKNLELRIDPDIVQSQGTPQFIGMIKLTWGSKLAYDILEANDKSVHDSEIQQCKKALNETIVSILGARSGCNFYSLPVEETLSESMMDVTVAGPKLMSLTRTFAAIEENDEEEEEEVAAAAAAAAAAEEKRAVVVTVERDRIFIPPVKVGDRSVIKVKLKNLGSVAQVLSIDGLEPPFSSNYTQVEIKPKYVLNFPILYAPKAKGSHVANVEFTPLNDASVAKVCVILKGSTL